MRTADKIAARQAAREKHARAMEQRRRTREAEQTALSAFEFALQRRDDTGLSAAVIALVNLGNSVKDIAAFTNQDSSEIRRLRALVSPRRTDREVPGGSPRVHQLPG